MCEARSFHGTKLTSKDVRGEEEKKREHFSVMEKSKGENGGGGERENVQGMFEQFKGELLFAGCQPGSSVLRKNTIWV